MIGEVPGLLSVAIAIGTRCRRSASTGGSLLFPQHVERAGQQHRCRAGARHRGDAGLVGVFEMVGRERAVLGRELRAAEVGELVGMQLDRQARRLRGREHPRGLRGRERNAFAERIDRVGEAGRGRAAGIIAQTSSI